MSEKNLTLEEKETINKNTKKASKDLFLEYMPYLIIIFFVVIGSPVSISVCFIPLFVFNSFIGIYCMRFFVCDKLLLYTILMCIVYIKRFDIVVIKTDSGDLIKRVIGLPGDKIKYEVKYVNEEKTGVLTINGEVVEEKFLTTSKKIGTCETNWTICSEEITVPEGEYFVMGDNRDDSKDSRMIGTIPFKDVKGTTELILFPFNRFGKVKKYN